MRFSKIVPLLSAALLAGTSLVAGAQNLSNTGDNSLRTGATYQSTNSGANYSWYDTGALKLSDGSSSFWAYCIDPRTGSDFPEAYSALTLDSYLNGTSSSGYAQQIARSGYSGLGLSNSSATQARVMNNLVELFSYAYSDSLTSAVKSAAFGMAVWEIVMQDFTAVASGDSFSRTGGRARSTGGDTTSGNNDAREAQLNTYLSALSNNTWASIGLGTATNWVYTVYFDNVAPATQTFIKVSSAPTSVPEPGTLALAGLALAGLVAGRRRLARRG